MAAKKTKPAPIAISEDVIARTAETAAIKSMVELADAFYWAALHGPYSIEISALVSCYVGGTKNQYRRVNVHQGMRMIPTDISIGKKAGLIFTFKPAEEMLREKEPVERIELTWDDVINHFEDLSDRIEARMGERGQAVLVKDVNDQIKAAITRNPSMHSILTEGFSKAQTNSRKVAQSDSLEGIPGFGMF